MGKEQLRRAAGWEHLRGKSPDSETAYYAFLKRNSSLSFSVLSNLSNLKEVFVKNPCAPSYTGREVNPEGLSLLG